MKFTTCHTLKAALLLAQRQHPLQKTQKQIKNKHHSKCIQLLDLRSRVFFFFFFLTFEEKQFSLSFTALPLNLILRIFFKSSYFLLKSFNNSQVKTLPGSFSFCGGDCSGEAHQPGHAGKTLAHAHALLLVQEERVGFDRQVVLQRDLGLDQVLQGDLGLHQSLLELLDGILDLPDLTHEPGGGG